MIIRRVASSFACLALVTLAACGGDKPAADTPPAGASAGSTGASAAKGGAAGAAGASAAPTAGAAGMGLGGAGGGPTGPGGLKGRPTTVTGIHLDPALITQCKIDEGSTYFEYDPPTLKGPDLTPLNLLSTCVTKGPLKGKTVEVVGYADGDAKGSRAQAVADYLEAKDVKKEKLKVVTKGDEKTLAKLGKTASEPALTPDRRVTVRLGKLGREGRGGRPDRALARRRRAPRQRWRHAAENWPHPAVSPAYNHRQDHAPRALARALRESVPTDDEQPPSTRAHTSAPRERQPARATARAAFRARAHEGRGRDLGRAVARAADRGDRADAGVLAGVERATAGLRDAEIRASV